MKKMLLSILVLALFSSLTLPQNKTITTFLIPDVDGKYQDELSSQTDGFFKSLYNPDAYTLFSNFPVKGGYVVFSPKTGGIFCNMDADADLELVFGSGQVLYAINKDTSYVTGWPKTYAVNNEVAWSISFGDIDGDGQGELVTGVGGALGGKIYAYEKDGTDVTGFPFTTGKYPMGVTLADVDNNGSLEIVFGDRVYRANVLKGDGTQMPGWPKLMDRYVAANASVGDVNNDGFKEIFIQSTKKIHGFDKDGNTLPGFPYTIRDTVNGSNSYSASILVDIDNDGQKEIVFGSHESSAGVMYVIKNNGTTYPGWPKTCVGWVYGAPSIADVDGDDTLDILFPEYGSSTTPDCFIYGFKKDGTALPNFPLGPFFGMANQITIANLDSDPAMELLFDQNIQFGDSGYYNAVNLDNTPVTGYPLNVQKNTSFQQPSLLDVDGNNTLDIFGGSFNFAAPKDAFYYLWNTGLPYNEDEILLPMYLYDAQHTGYFNKYNTIPVELESFTSLVNGNKVTLNWSTSTETNNSHFIIKRDGNVIGNVTGKGTTSEKQIYSFVDQNLLNGTYTYTLVQVDYDGTSKVASSLTADVNSLTYTLSQNYPNPFNPTTNISFSIAMDGNVKLSVYNILGQEVAQLVNGFLKAGVHKINFDASSLSTGTYFYKITANNYSEVKKLSLVK